MKKESDLEKIIRLRGIDREAVHSIDRNIRACYPNKTESEIEQLTIKNLIDNLSNCK